MVFITGKGTADGKNLAGSVRRHLQNQGTIVGMMRFPSGMFAEYAKTNVVADLIIVRKNRADGLNPEQGITWWSETGESSTINVEADAVGRNHIVPEVVPDMTSLSQRGRNMGPRDFITIDDTLDTDDAAYDGFEGEVVSLNQHWVDNPQDVIGAVGYGHGTTAKGPGLIVVPPTTQKETEQQIADWVSRLPENIFNTEKGGWEGEEEKAPDGKRQRTVTVDRDSKATWRIYEGTIAEPVLDERGERKFTTVELDAPALSIVVGENLVPLQSEVSWATANTKKIATLEAKAQAIADLADVRDAYSTLLYLQRTSDSEVDIESARAALNEAYDKFVENHGYIQKSDALKTFRKARDPMAASLETLSVLDDRTNEYVKRQIFSKSTVVRNIGTIENASLADAFAIERNRSLTIDYKRIAKMANMSEEDVLKELQDANYIYKNELGDYQPSDLFLSGNVRKKLRALQAAKDAGVDGLDKSIDAIKKIIPAPIPHHKIDLKLAPHFVPVEIYKQFLAEKLNVDVDEIGLRLSHGKWNVNLTTAINNRQEALDWGAEARHETGNKEGQLKVPFSEFVRLAMNGGTIKIMHRVAVPGEVDKFREEVDEIATAAANEKLEQFRQEYKNWVWSDAARANEIAAMYNEEYNSFVLPTYENVPLTFIGIITSREGEPFELRTHQKRAVWRGVVEGRGIYAHEVGTGKTLTMAALAMESRRLGKAKKPILFAANTNYRQVFNEITEHYPAARVLLIDTSNKNARELSMSLIPAEDWDLIVAPHSTVDQFTMTEESLRELMDEELRTLEEAAREAFAEDSQARGAFPENLDDIDREGISNIRSRTAKELVEQRFKITQMIKKAAKLSKSENLFFEDMGIDMIMVDEAHEFKKIPISTTQQLKGLNITGSKRGIVLKLLTDHVRRVNNGRGVYTFTGTPITNTINEIFNQMRFVMEDVMKDAKVKDWDSWFSLFAEAVVDQELTGGGVWEPVTRLRSFTNLPELRQMIGQVLDIVNAKDMVEFKPRKDKEGRVPDNEKPVGVPYKQVINVTSKPSKFMQDYSNALVWRYITGKNAKGSEARNLLEIAGQPFKSAIIGNEGVKMSLDPRMTDMMLNPKFGFEPVNAKDPELKVNKMIANAMPLYRDNPKSTQMIFMESGFKNKAERATGRFEVDEDGKRKAVKVEVEAYDLSEEIKRRLMEEGVPENEIVIMSKLSDEKRMLAAMDMRKGKIRFAIGSTQSMGVGVNAQDEMIALHHLDCPWMPGWLEQRIGRMVRQGNRYNTVYEYRYIAENAQDARRWQVALIKDTFIKLFLDFSTDMRSFDMEDVDIDENGTGDMESSLAAATGDPRIMLRNRLSLQLERLSIAERSFRKNVEAQLRNAEDKQRTIAMRTEIIKGLSRLSETSAVDVRSADETIEVLYPQYTGDKNPTGYVKLDNGQSEHAVTLALLRIKNQIERSAQTEGALSEMRIVRNMERKQLVAIWRGLPVYNVIKLDSIEEARARMESGQGFKTWSTELYIGPPISEKERADIEANGMAAPAFNTLSGLQVQPTLLSMQAMLRQVPGRIKNNKKQIELAKDAIARAAESKDAVFPKQDQLDRLVERVNRVQDEIARNPKPSPNWFRVAAPQGTLVYVGDKKYIVESHRGISELVVLDMNDNLTVIEAKDVKNAPDGEPVFAELQEGYDGPVDITQEPENLKTVKRHQRGQHIQVDFGSYSTMFTEDELAAVGFSITQPATWQVSGEVASDTEAGSDEIKVVFRDIGNETKGSGKKTIEITIKPQMETSYMIDSIETSVNPVLSAMQGVYRRGEITGFVVEGNGEGRVTAEKMNRSEVIDPPVIPTVTVSVSDRITELLTLSDRRVANEYFSLQPEDRFMWINEKLGGELYEYYPPTRVGETDPQRKELRDQSDVDMIIKSIEDQFNRLLDRGSSQPASYFANPQVAQRKGATPLSTLGTPVPLRGDGGQAQFPVDTAKKKKMGRIADTEPLSAQQIIARLSSLYDLPIFAGNVSNRALGVYKHLSHIHGSVSPGIVRLNRRHANNLAVVAHEIAHHIDEITGITSDTNLDAVVRNQLEGLDYDQARKPDGPMAEEGFAELIRAYLTLDSATQQTIPDYKDLVDWLENTWGKANPQELKRLKQAKQYFQRYMDMSVMERLQSAVRLYGRDTFTEKAKRTITDLTTKGGREYLYDTLLRGTGGIAYQRIKDRYWALRTMQRFNEQELVRINKERASQGLPPLANYYDKNESAYEYASAVHNTSAANAEAAFKNGVFFITKGGRRQLQDTAVAPALNKIKNRKDLNLAELYLIAHHIVEMDAKKKRDAAKKKVVFNYVWPISVEDAKNYLNKVKGKQLQRYEELRKALNRHNNGLLAMQLDAGVISNDAYMKMLAEYSSDPKNPNGDLYLPLHREMQLEGDTTTMQASRHVDLAPATKRRSKTGSVRPVVSPIEATLDRGMTFYRTAQSHEILELARQESKLNRGFGKFIEELDPSMALTSIPVKRLMQQLVKMGYVDKDYADAMVVADEIRTAFKAQGAVNYSGLTSQENEEWLMDYAGYAPGTYTPTDIKTVVDATPSALAFLQLWDQDFDTIRKGNPNVKLHTHNGEQTLLRMSDEILESLSGNHAWMAAGVTQKAGKLTRGFKTGSVGINTFFGARQISMDYMTNLFQSKEQGVSRYWMPLVYSAQFALDALRQAVGYDTNNKVMLLYRAYNGEILHELAPDTDAKRNFVGKMLADRRGLKPKRALNVLGSTYEAFKKLVALSDVGPRYAEFVAALKNRGYKVNGITGKLQRWNDVTKQYENVEADRHDILRGILAAADVTYNYRRNGTLGQVAEQYVPFTNARFEGADKKIRTLANVATVGTAILRGDGKMLKKAEKNQAFFTTANTILSLGVGALYFASKRRDEDYKEQEWWMRGRGISIQGDEPGVQKYFIPNSREWAWTMGTGELLAKKYFEETEGVSYDAFSEKEKELVPENLSLPIFGTQIPFVDDVGIPRTEGTEMMQQQWKMIFGGSNMFGFDSGIPATIIGVMTGEDQFTGRQIEPSWMEEQNLPEFERYTDSSTPWGKWLGRNVTPHDYSPLEWDFALNNLSGGLARRLGKDWKAYQEDGLSYRHLPVVGGVMTNRFQKRSVDDLYRAHTALEYRKSLNEADPEAWEFSEDQNNMLEEVTDARALLALMSQASRNEKEAERVAAARLMVGVAREALGRDELENSPSPWKLSKSEFPESFTRSENGQRSVYDEYVRFATRMIEDTKPSRTDPDKQMYANGNTRQEEWERRLKLKAYAENWLKNHADSPIVKEAKVQHVLDQRKKVKKRIGLPSL